MDELLILKFAFAFVIFAFIFLMMFLQKRHPSSIKKNKNNGYPDSYIVSVWNFGRGSGYYIDHLFVKKKNGKYRMKYGILDWFITIVTVVPFTAMYVWIVKNDWNTIIKYPKELIPAYILLGILFLLLVLLFNNGKIRARLYFYKFMKDLKKIKKADTGKK